MPAYAALDKAITRLAKKATTANQVLALAEAYDKIQHAGEEPKEGFAASGADMLDGNASFNPPEDRMGFRPQPRTRS